MCEVLGLVTYYVDMVDGKVRDDIGPFNVVDDDIVVQWEELMANDCLLGHLRLDMMVDCRGKGDDT